MSNRFYPKKPRKQNQKVRDHEVRTPSIPKIIAEVKELTQELFLHPAEKPLFTAPVFRS